MITFKDYYFHGGIDSSTFVRLELHQVTQMLFYEPVIVDATLTGRSKCYFKRLTARDIMGNLRTGDNKDLDTGPRSLSILNSIPQAYEPFTSSDLNGAYVRRQNLMSSIKSMRSASE